MKPFFFLIILILLSTAITAQSDCYNGLRYKGIRLVEEKQYKEAINQFFAALYCLDRPEKNDLVDLIKKTQDTWIQELNQALQRAEKAEHEARELAARQDTLLRYYFQGDSTYITLLTSGKEKFKNGQYQEALYDFAILQFSKSSAEVKFWIEEAQKGQKAKKLALNGDLDNASKAFEMLIALDSNDFRTTTLRRIISSQTLWREATVDTNTNFIAIIPNNLNNLYFISNAILKLNKIEKLNLSGNLHLYNLPPENLSILSQHSSLKILNIAHGELYKLPVKSWEVLAQISSLQEIHFENNQLKFLPKECWEALVKSSSIKALYLANNGLHDSPVENWNILSKLSSLQILDLSFNNFLLLATSGWKAIAQLPSLKELNLSMNELGRMPKENWQIISNLTSLHSLDLSYNELNSIPDEVGQLTELKYLNLSENQLQNVKLDAAIVSKEGEEIKSFTYHGWAFLTLPNYF